MAAKIGGSSGRINVDREVRVAVIVFVGLVKCQCFMWFMELGGSVIVEWYARRR